jgi:hypothetical protein
VHGREQLVALPLRRRNAVEAGLNFERLARGEERVENNFLGNDSDRALRIARMLVDVERPDRDFPAPFGPSSPKICPRGTSKLTSFSARLPPA